MEDPRAIRTAHSLFSGQHTLLHIRPHRYFNAKSAFIGGLEGHHLTQVAVKDAIFICTCYLGRVWKGGESAGRTNTIVCANNDWAVLWYVLLLPGFLALST